MAHETILVATNFSSWHHRRQDTAESITFLWIFFFVHNQQYLWSLNKHQHPSPHYRDQNFTSEPSAKTLKLQSVNIESIFLKHPKLQCETSKVLNYCCF